LFVVVGAATLDAVIKFSDAMIFALVFPNMIGLLLLFPRVRKKLKIILVQSQRKKKLLKMEL
jgi:AGCS family alanine or glycine:cation symporter